MLTFLGIEPRGLESCSYSSRVVDGQALARATAEESFAREALAILEELLQSVDLAARVRRVDKQAQPRSLNRDEAVLAGQMVRLAKLHRGLLRFCEPPQMELFGFLLRGAIETGVDLRYLVQHGTPDVYEAFVRGSLRLDKEFHDRIKAEAEARGGTVLPMEYGLLTGIEQAFSAAGVAIDSVDARARAGWTKGGAYGRFRALGLQELYASYFGMQSNYVHGAWQELYQHHLAVQPDGSFLPKPAFESLALPPLTMAIDVLVSASASYLHTAAPACPDRDVLEDRINFCGQKGHVVTQAYRIFRGMPDLSDS